MPPHAALLQMLTGKWLSIGISMAARFGVADHLETGPRTADELAAATGIHGPSLYRLLRALASVGVFSETEDGRFTNTPLSDLLRSNSKPSVRNMAMMLLDDWHLDIWREAPWTLATGKAAPFKVWGKQGFERFAEHPEDAVNFNNAMTDMSTADSAPTAAAYDFSGFRDIVDVGGGLGMLLSEILKKTPGLRGILFEMPYFIDKVRASPLLQPYADRCEVVAGSFFESVPEADAYILKHIIHDWDDEKSKAILSTCRKSIRPGGKLLLAEAVVPPRNEPGFVKILDLEMLMIGGLERTEQQYRDLYASAGFRLDRIIPTRGPMQIIEGSPV